MCNIYVSRGPFSRCLWHTNELYEPLHKVAPTTLRIVSIRICILSELAVIYVSVRTREEGGPVREIPARKCTKKYIYIAVKYTQAMASDIIFFINHFNFPLQLTVV